MGCLLCTCLCAKGEEDDEVSLAKSQLLKEKLLARRGSAHLEHLRVFLPEDKGLTVYLCRCVGLPSSGGSPCPYVKFYISDNIDGRQRSIGKSSTKNPVWSPHQMFQFLPLKSNMVDDLSLICNVMDKDMIGKDDHLGDGVVRLKGLEDECVNSSGHGIIKKR